MGPLKLVCPAHSGPRDAVHLPPMTTFMLLVSFQLVIGVSLFVVGLSTFTYTPSYRIGSFWAGFIIHALFTLQVLAISANLAAVVVDILGAYLLQNTDFSRCSYTSSPATVHCNTTSCPALTVPSNTCSCCYLYNNRAYAGCETILLTAKQTYFVSVGSCLSVPGMLVPMLYALGCLEVLGIVVSITLFCQGQVFVWKVKHDDRTTVPESKIPTSAVPDSHTGTVPEAELTGAEYEELNVLGNGNPDTIPEAVSTETECKEVNSLGNESESYLKQEAHKEEKLKIERQSTSNTEIHITIDNRNQTTADAISSAGGAIVTDRGQKTNGEGRTVPDEEQIIPDAGRPAV
eukprot:Em0018g88a